ncbi:MAG: 4Fe-4S dicluster domain-containing protein [Syntrophobacteraceae bacterium]|jgi:ferredoxin
MSIFHVLMKNLRNKPATLRIPEQTPHPQAFRGPVKIDVEKCIGCGMCAYVCVSYAVRVNEFEDSCEWLYLPGRCTFCGRCTAVCPGGALRMENGSVPIYCSLGELDETHRVPYPACPECGRPSRPVAESVLKRAFGEPSEKVRKGILLCQRCRLRRSQKDLWATAGKSIHARGESPE